MKKQCNPFKIMFQDTMGLLLILGKISLLIVSALVQSILIAGSFDYVYTNVIDKETGEFIMEATTLAVWCQRGLAIEALVIVLVALRIWYVSAKGRC